MFPIIFDSKFFQNYCILFYKKNLKKLYSIYEILCFHNKNAKKKIINLEEEIMECYHKTGIYLIEQKKLFNEQIFDFIHKDKYLIQDDKVNEKKVMSIIKIITLGINFDKKEIKFIDNIINNKIINDFNAKYFLGSYMVISLRKYLIK